MVDEYCERCAYKEYIGCKSECNEMCAYILITGEARSKICSSGKGCTVRRIIPGKSIERKRHIVITPKPTKPPIEKEMKIKPEKTKEKKAQKKSDTPQKVADVRKMAEKGMSDSEIGKKIGLSKNAVWKCRKRNNIPAGTKPADVEAVREMVAQGMSDRKIGEKLGKAKRTICDLRHRYNIPAAIKPIGGRKNG